MILWQANKWKSVETWDSRHLRCLKKRKKEKIFKVILYKSGSCSYRGRCRHRLITRRDWVSIQPTLLPNIIGSKDHSMDTRSRSPSLKVRTEIHSLKIGQSWPEMETLQVRTNLLVLVAHKRAGAAGQSSLRLTVSDTCLMP